MSWLARLRNVFRRDAVSDEIDRELRFHLAEREDDLVAAGHSPDEARREAARRFGPYVPQRERTRDRDLLAGLETFLTDLRYGLRGLRRSPVFGLTAVLTLAIGIGANTAVFTLLHGLLLRSLPVPHPQELVRVGTQRIDTGRDNWSVTYKLLDQYRQQQRSFVDLSAWRTYPAIISERSAPIGWHQVGLLSGNAFDLIGLRPAIGRLITTADDVRHGSADGWPAVMSHAFWQEQFAGDPRVLGAQLEIAGTPITVIGVAPAAFHGPWPGVEPRLYLPITVLAALTSQPSRTQPPLDLPTSFLNVSVIGRLRPGVTIDQARAELGVLDDQLITHLAPPNARINGQPLEKVARLMLGSARTGLPSVFGELFARPILLMQGLVAIVLLLCCVNVSGLMLSKLHERQHEFAVRTAIGAGRLRLARQFLTESFVIAASGAALGAAAAWFGSTRLLPFFRDPNMGVGLDLQPDRTVFLVTASLAVATTMFFGLLPAWRAGRTHPGVLLKSRSAAQRPTAGRGFVALQVALSVVLVAFAALLSQSLARLQGEPTGFDVNHVTIQTPPFHLLPQKGEAKLDLYQRMVERIEQGANVRGAAVTWYTPMTGLQAMGKFQALTDGGAAPPDVTLAFNSVGPGYFRTIGTAMRAGREFDPRERRRDVCVVNQAAAAKLLGQQPALDRSIRTTENLTPRRAPAPGQTPSDTITMCRVIGIAEDAKFANLREPPPPTIYYPMTPDIVDINVVFLLNAQTKVDAIAAYRDALREQAPSIPLVLFATLREQMDAALGGQRAITFLSAFFGIVALLLSTMGLYGMLSSNVSQRTSEIGIRAALGASRGAILRMVLADALRPVLAGVLMGAIALIYAVRWIAYMLYGVSSFDFTSLIATALLLALVVLVASAWPARRAAAIDPLEAMRAE